MYNINLREQEVDAITFENCLIQILNAFSLIIITCNVKIYFILLNIFRHYLLKWGKRSMDQMQSIFK